MSTIGALAIFKTARDAAGKTAAVAAGNNAFDSPRPNAHGALFIFFEFLREFFDGIAFLINRKSADFNGVFDDDFGVLRHRLSGGE